MLSQSSLFDLIARRFDPDSMVDAFIEKVEDRIDYGELAEAVIEEHESEIDSIIAELAEDSLR